MGYREMEELRKRKRDQLVLLMEVSDLTRQISEALDRKDQVSMQLLLSLREDPIRRMAEIDAGIEDYLRGLPEDEAIRCHELLEGDAAENGEEVPLADQVDRYLNTLDSVVEADKRLSIRLSGSKSFYNTFRE